MVDGSSAEWLEQVRDAERRGELLAAVDLAERGLMEHPADVALQHRAVLALARAGATGEAARRYATYGLDAIRDEDVAALGARIAKDLALARRGTARAKAAQHAADLYTAIYERTSGYYPAINAATLLLVAGEKQRAQMLAQDVLRALPDADDGSYYAAATEAEAHLLLGDADPASNALKQAARSNGGDFGALATTRRQLRLVCELQGLDPIVLQPLVGPSVAHYCGHVVSAEGATGPFPAEAERQVAKGISRELSHRPVGFAYGSLAAGADVMWAEALVSSGAELHVVLPFNLDEFVASSVAPAGARWVDRVHTCLEHAASVTYGTKDALRRDDALFRYCSELAMGLAVLRARYLDADVHQLAVWDGAAARGEAGTAIDAARWKQTGRPVAIIYPAAARARGVATTQLPAVVETGVPAQPPARVVRAMLFGDIKGFSKLADEQLPRFSVAVLGNFARVLDRHADVVEHRNTWGDGLYAVVRNFARAAVCALELQETMDEIDFDKAGLPSHLALRLGGHVGPVFPVHDPVLGAGAFMGSHVSRTARVEPVTPPGEVYVTEPFAAALALNRQDEVACDYVGHLPAAKDFGRLRMYRLSRAVGAADVHFSISASAASGS